MNAGKHRSEKKPALPISVSVGVHLWFALVSGCSSDNAEPATRPASVRDRQDAALKDPFGYDPNVENNDVSGGDLGTFDRKAMKRDIDHVLNP